MQSPDVPTRVQQRSIPLTSLGLIATSFATGALVALIISNALAKEHVTFATDVLITFVATVGLGVASVFLAIVAIDLSRRAEEVLIKRSDEGIRLQNETFLRTNDVLTQIQTSTGMTERRIEDIIAGRAKLIINDAIDRTVAGPKNPLSKQTADRLKAEITDSLRADLASLISVPAMPTNSTSNILGFSNFPNGYDYDTSRDWNLYRSSVVAALTKDTDTELLSVGSGNFEADDLEDFWDAILTIHDVRLGLDIRVNEDNQIPSYRPNSLATKGGREHTINRLIEQAHATQLAFVFMIFDRDTSPASIPSRLRPLIDVQNAKTSDLRIVLLAGETSHVANEIRDTISRYLAERSQPSA